MFALKIKEFRKQKGWTQQKLAEKSGLSFNAITKIEQNLAKHPTMQTLVKLADAFNVSIDNLIGRK